MVDNGTWLVNANDETITTARIQLHSADDIAV